MTARKVWTKQHKNVRKVLEETGRYTVKKEYICLDMKEQKDLILTAYDWLSQHMPNKSAKPKDVQYPVWVSLTEDAVMMPDENEVVLELSVDESLITLINVTKWGMILNYSYIPRNEKDAAAHQELLSLYGTSDAQAVMTPFYPEIRREVMESWSRLFDDSVLSENSCYYGLIWEMRKEWITTIRQ